MHSNVDNSLWASCPVLHSSSSSVSGSLLPNPKDLNWNPKHQWSWKTWKKVHFVWCVSTDHSRHDGVFGRVPRAIPFFSLQVQIDSTNTVVAHYPWFRNLFSVKEFQKFDHFFHKFLHRASVKIRSGNEITRIQGFSENMVAGFLLEQDHKWLCQPALVPSLQPACLLWLTLWLSKSTTGK